MLGWLAALCFAIAYVFYGAGFNHGTWLSPVALVALGLTFLAIHLTAPLAVPVVTRRRGDG